MVFYGAIMATLADLQQALGNPNVRKMLDLIASTEGTTKNGYNTAFGGGRFDNLSAHPNVRSAFTQTDGNQNSTTAAGRYQFLKGTWDGLSKQYGFRDFSPKAQDMGAIALLAQNGALKDAMNGDFQTAIQKSGKTWASLPSSQYAQNKKSWDYVNQQLGRGVGSKTSTLTVADLEKQYGKGNSFSFNGNDQTAPNSVASLEAQYGKGIDFDFGQPNQAITTEQNPLTVSDLEAQYGKGIDYNFQG